MGGIVGLIIAMYIAIRAQTAQATGELFYDTKPTSTESCDYNFSPQNRTTRTTSDDGLQLHNISYLYYSCFATLVTLVVAFVVTAVGGEADPASVDVKLLAPFLRRFFGGENQPRREDNLEVTEHVFRVVDNRLISDDSKQWDNTRARRSANICCA